MNIQEILEYLPHRYPFLLIDRVIECELGKRIRALKNVSVNEPYFNGHFPYYKVMPGVLIVEAMAQAAAILSFRTMGIKPDDKSVYYFAGIDRARFKKPVMPGRPAGAGGEHRAHRAQRGQIRRQGLCGRCARGRSRTALHLRPI